MSDINQFIKDKVTSYLDNHPNLTTNTIAKKAGIHLTTLKNIMENNSKPTALTCVSIIKIVCNKDSVNIQDIMDHFTTNEAQKVFNSVFPKTKTGARVNDSDRKLINHEQAKVTLQNPLAHMIFTYMQKGYVSEQDIQDQFGAMGIQMVAQFIGCDLVKRVEEGYELVNKKIILDFDDYKESIKLTADMLSKDDIGKGTQVLHSTRAGVSDEGSKDLYQESLEYTSRVNKIINEKKGDRPVVVGLAYKTFMTILILFVLPISLPKVIKTIKTIKTTTPVMESDSGSDSGTYGAISNPKDTFLV